MTGKRLTPIARKLRLDRTEVEDKLWQRIRNRQIEGEKFVFQFPIGLHIADFACRTARLAVEHHKPVSCFNRRSAASITGFAASSRTEQ